MEPFEPSSHAAAPEHLSYCLVHITPMVLLLFCTILKETGKTMLNFAAIRSHK